MNKIDINNKIEESDTSDSVWLVTYSDTITLLLVFFVLLLSISSIDQSKYETAMDAIKQEGFNDKQYMSSFDYLQKNLEETLSEELNQTMTLEKSKTGVVIEISSNSLYKSGSADMKDEIKSSLYKIIEQIKNFQYKRYIVEIEGHTDDIPVSSIQFPTNWELSTMRATTVARFFIDNNISKNVIKAVGYADTRPKVDNNSSINRAMNRRVVINIDRE